MPADQHLSALLPSKNSRLVLGYRSTPTPGPNELLIEVKAVAANPSDYYSRDFGFPPIEIFPMVLGSDVAGIVLQAGSTVPADAPKPGTRVAAFASAYFSGNPDHAAFQTRVLVPAAQVTPLPEGLSFRDASVLPVAVTTAWTGLRTLGISSETAYTSSDKKGILVWGGASSVGCAVVQIARSLGFTVFATASRKHHDYLGSLGASNVFDYHDEDVADQIKAAAKQAELRLKFAYDAVGNLQPCVDILKDLRGHDETAMSVSTKPVPADLAAGTGVEANFVLFPPTASEREEHFRFIFGVWLKEKLATAEFVSSPHI